MRQKTENKRYVWLIAKTDVHSTCSRASSELKVESGKGLQANEMPTHRRAVLCFLVPFKHVEPPDTTPPLRKQTCRETGPCPLSNNAVATWPETSRGPSSPQGLIICTRVVSGRTSGDPGFRGDLTPKCRRGAPRGGRGTCGLVCSSPTQPRPASKGKLATCRWY